MEPSAVDGTLIWDERKAPYMSAGIMILDELVSEKAAESTLSFAPGNDTRGISLYRTEMADITDYMCRIEAVSYTHLDVYKRQNQQHGIGKVSENDRFISGGTGTDHPEGN